MAHSKNTPVIWTRKKKTVLWHPHRHTCIQQQQEYLALKINTCSSSSNRSFCHGSEFCKHKKTLPPKNGQFWNTIFKMSFNYFNDNHRHKDISIVFASNLVTDNFVSLRKMETVDILVRMCDPRRSSNGEYAHFLWRCRFQTSLNKKEGQKHLQNTISCQNITYQVAQEHH